MEKAKERSAASGHQDEEFTPSLVLCKTPSRSSAKMTPFWLFYSRHSASNPEAHRVLRSPFITPDSDLSLLSGLSDFASCSGFSGPRTPASSREYENAAFYYNINQQMLNKSQTRSHVDSSLQDLAREFGTDPHVVQPVQALAQRLAGMY